MITLMVTLAVIGVLLYCVETFLPMSPPIKLVIRVVVVVCVVLWLLRVFGVTDIPVPRLRGAPPA